MRPLCPCFSILLACGAGASTAPAGPGPVAPRPPGPDLVPGPGESTVDDPGKWGGVEALVPFQVWPTLPGRVTGLLFSHQSAALGGAFDHMRNFSADPAPRLYRFSVDGSSPYALYFPSKGEGENFLAQWSVETPAGYRTYDAAMFAPETKDAWALDGELHLVELEVNDGAGGQGVHFVATEVRKVDDRFARPLDQLAREGAARFAARVAAQASALDAPHQAPTTRRTGVAPTFLSITGHLELRFLVEVASERAIGAPRSETTTCPPCPCTPQGCAPCAYCDPVDVTVQDVERVVTELAARYEIDARGAIVVAQEHPARTTRITREDRIGPVWRGGPHE